MLFQNHQKKVRTGNTLNTSIRVALVKNIEFHRNGAKVIVKNDKIDFMDDGYFKTGPFLVKLEKDKLIVNCKQNTENLTMNSDNMIKKSNQEIQLKGNSELALNDEFIFNANEILVISN